MENTQGTYVAVKLLNTKQVIDFCEQQGLIISKPDELHVTIAFSRTPFQFNAGIVNENVTIPVGSSRFGILGDNHLVLFLDSIILQCEHQRTLEAGASFDYQTFTPHITIEYECGNVDISHLQNPMFEIILGEEYIEPLNLDWIKN